MDAAVETLKFGNYLQLKTLCVSFMQYYAMSPIARLIRDGSGYLKIPNAASCEIDLQKPIIDKHDHAQFTGEFLIFLEKNFL